jgi:AcrR family transcriptional regulator
MSVEEGIRSAEPRSGDSADVARLRLIEAMSTVVAEKGYAAATIADIVAAAHVSRRTFYEHFGDKEDCLLACHALSADRMLTALRAGVDKLERERIRPEIHELISLAVHTVLTVLSDRPALTRTHFAEMQAAGPRARAARRQSQNRFAEMLQQLAILGREYEIALLIPSTQMATALVGGISELIVQSVEEGRAAELAELSGTIIDLLDAVLARSAP